MPSPLPPTMIRFAKMHGLGNDFVVIDGVRQQLPAGFFCPETARALAARRLGVGCDQLLALLPADDGCAADFAYRIFNADGGEAGQCGNGARCAIWFLRREGIFDRDEALLQTPTTTIRAALVGGESAQATLQAPTDGGTTEMDGHVFRLLDLGNPHAVCLNKPADDETLVALAARLSAAAPDGVNVGVGVVGEDGIALRVVERGSGLTDACGSGAAAAAACAIRDGLAPNPVTVKMRGGEALCGVNDDGGVWLRGAVAHVFDGVWEWRGGR